MYCDSQNICRCKKEYPVVVGIHSCRQPKKIFERCSHPEECHYSDPNAYCTQTPYSSQCECLEGFVYDKFLDKCVDGLYYRSICSHINHIIWYLYPLEPKPKKSSNSALMIPAAAGFLMACFSLLCCCALIWHNICRKHDISDRNAHQMCLQTNRSRNQTERNRNSSLNSRNIANISSNESQATTHLPPYESVLILHDEPPPSYEDAIKDSRMVSSRETTAETKAWNLLSFTLIVVLISFLHLAKSQIFFYISVKLWMPSALSHSLY